MGELEIIEERPLTLAELKTKLGSRKATKEENIRTKKMIDYLDNFSKLKPKENEEIKKKINELNISRLKEKSIAKIIDIKPEDIDSLRMILTGDNTTIKQDDLKKILECLK